MSIPNHLQRTASIVLALSCCLLAACHKDDTNPAESAASYFNLKTGNYWIYETFVVDSNGNGSPGSDPYSGGGTALLDSTYVEKDTAIRGTTYYKLMQPLTPDVNEYQAIYLRDSSGYEITSDGNIVFAPNDFATTFRQHEDSSRIASGDSVIRYEKAMGDKDYTKITPAGSFKTTALVETVVQIPYVADGLPTRRHRYNRYSMGVGLVSQTLPYFSLQPNYIERKLVRYHSN